MPVSTVAMKNLVAAIEIFSIILYYRSIYFDIALIFIQLRAICVFTLNAENFFAIAHLQFFVCVMCDWETMIFQHE